jgi:hypothetical protein
MDRKLLGVLGLGVGVLGLMVWVGLRYPPKPPADRLGGDMTALKHETSHASSERPCLAGPSDVTEEEGMAASEGLDPVEAARAARSAAQASLSCFRGSPSVTLDLNVNVKCSGRVSKVEVLDDGGASPSVVGCVTKTFEAAVFPQHALPDGDSFEYPLSYNAPG